MYGEAFCKSNCCENAAAAAWDANNTNMLPWLVELRRTYGNSWEVLTVFL